MVTCNYGCGGGVYFGYHSCQMTCLCGEFLVWWVVILTPIHLEDIINMNELKIMSRLCGKLYCTCKG